MNGEQEHEIVPTIRGWLAATSDIEIPVGLCREEARRRGRKLLVAIAADRMPPDNLEVDDDLKDVIWAAVEELDATPPGERTLEDCDRFYQFVLQISIMGDTFDEWDEILHWIATIGWQSAPGGLRAVLEVRSAVWEYGDKARHRVLCESAGGLSDRLKALRLSQAYTVTEVRDICSCLLKLSSFYPNLVASSYPILCSVLKAQPVGRLDEREHLTALTWLVGAMAERQLGNWKAARLLQEQAAAALRRTVSRVDLERIECERLALVCARGNHRIVCELAPALIESVQLPRERFKAQLIWACSLLNLERPAEARGLLEASGSQSIADREHGLRAWQLTKLGTAFSYLHEESKAMDNFRAAADILRNFPNLLHSADLIVSVGEHLGSVGRTGEAATLYALGREIYRKVGNSAMVGYVSVLIAELMMMAGDREDARAELVGVLPLIEKLSLWQEALACVTLLRRTMGKRQTDAGSVKRLRDQLPRGPH